jgi:predicted nuclease with TOPRIM domain
MTKTDELISKLEELVEEVYYSEQNRDNSYIKKLKSEISQLKEQIKKEENINDFTIPYLKSEYNQQLERITKIIGKKKSIQM